MSLTGIRDLSLITTPPSERQPILTYVGEHDERAVAEALRRELLREGQIFYVHNRVHDIEQRRGRPAPPRPRRPRRRRPRPDGRRHSRAGRARLLGRRLRRPRLHDDHRVGHRHALCQHPRRRPGGPPRSRPAPPAAGSGRASRAGAPTPTSCSLPTGCSPSRPTSGSAPSASTPSSGPGFKIAMRDLEIRGAGNLLGRDQSGHIAAVGYDLYVRLVAEAVSELKGEPVRVPVDITVDLPVDAFLPADLRGTGGPAPRGLPEAGRGPRRRSGRGPAQRMARPLRPAARTRPRHSWPSGACGPSAFAQA